MVLFIFYQGLTIQSFSRLFTIIFTRVRPTRYETSRRTCACIIHLQTATVCIDATATEVSESPCQRGRGRSRNAARPSTGYEAHVYAAS